MKNVKYVVKVGYSDELVFTSFAKAVKALETLDEAREPNEWEAERGEISIVIIKKFEPIPRPTEEPTEE